MTLRLLDIRATPLSVDEVIQAVSAPHTGGLVVFVGLVRDTDDGRRVSALDYSAHPSASDELRRVCEKIDADFGNVQLAAVHRVGQLAVGDIAVVVAAAAAHRGTAFDACRRLIDDLKAGVPIWKHQNFADGTEEWVGLP